LAPLASLKGLRTLDIRGGGAPPSGLASLTQLTSLTSNHDPASGIIEQLHKLTALQEFHIRDQHLSADLARALAALPALHTFRHGDGICYTRDPDALATLCTSSTLRHLALGGADAAPSPEEVASLRVAPSLQELTATFTDADQLRAIIPHLDHLDRLRLTLATQARRLTTPPTLIDAEMINLVASMTNIVALDIAQPHTYPAHHSTFAPDDLARLVALGRLEQLCITNLPPHITPPIWPGSPSSPRSAASPSAARPSAPSSRITSRAASPCAPCACRARTHQYLARYSSPTAPSRSSRPSSSKRSAS
jgi:hypothetical protein